jgi:Mg-chelatase subunit ChlD
MMHVTRSELRTATDAAAKAAMESLGREQKTSAAVDAALRVAKENQVAGKGLTLDRNQIVFGTATASGKGGFDFREGGGGSGNPLNAVRVTGQRTTGSPDGTVSLMFGSLFGVSNFQPQAIAAAARSERDIALVLDVSGSMAQFGRFDGLKNAMKVFLDELDRSPQKEHLSLACYSTTSRKLVDLTPDLNLVRAAFAKESPQGMTAIGLGLKTGLDSLLKDKNTRPFAIKTVILMTDGFHNTGIIPESVAPDCAKNGIKVHTVTFSSSADQSRMKEVARITGGIHFHANSNQDLVDQFRIIAQQLTVVLIE